jgi:hypothetical protein
MRDAASVASNPIEAAAFEEAAEQFEARAAAGERPDFSDGQRAVHGSIQDSYLTGEEVLVRWIFVAEVMTPEGKHLIYRAGGGDGGQEPGTAWEALGMLEAGVLLAERQVQEWSRNA